MWNFAGRQNDIMNMDGNEVYGNWEHGIGYSDEGMPSHLKDNKGKNHYYFLPLILGLIGIYFHFKSRKTDAISVLLFFLFTGVFIIVYLNVPPDQPRERDYAYVGSFYAFAIWIGIGVLQIFDLLKNKLNKKVSAVLATSICLLAVPILMASENWDDHDRSGRTIAIDVAKNYLEHLDANAIIFSNGDNDTYPLWYAQEVEGVRPDVRNVNMSLLGMDWYIDQTKQQVYDAAPVPSLLTHDFYRGNKRNTREGVVKVDFSMKRKSAKEAIKEIKRSNTCPGKIYIPIDEDNRIKISVNYGGLTNGDIALLDILANFNWERPLYFISARQTFGAFNGIEKYIVKEGALDKLVAEPDQGINVDKSYDLLMNKYNYGNFSDSNVNYDFYSRRSLVGFRIPFSYTLQQTMNQNDTIRSINLSNKYFDNMPKASTGLNEYVSVSMLEPYIKYNVKDRYNIITDLANEHIKQFEYLKLQNLNGEAQQLFINSIEKIFQLNNLIKEKEEENEKLEEERRAAISQEERDKEDADKSESVEDLDEEIVLIKNTIKDIIPSIEIELEKQPAVIEFIKSKKQKEKQNLYNEHRSVQLYNIIKQNKETERKKLEEEKKKEKEAQEETEREKNKKIIERHKKAKCFNKTEETLSKVNSKTCKPATFRKYVKTKKFHIEK